MNRRSSSQNTELKVAFPPLRVALAMAFATVVLLFPTAAQADEVVNWPNGRTCDAGRTVQVQSLAAGSSAGFGYVRHFWTVGGTDRHEHWYENTLETRYSFTYHRIATYGLVQAEAVSSAYMNCIQ